MNIEKLKDQFYEERSNYFNKYQKLYSEYCEDKSVLCQPKLKIFDEHPFLNVNSTLF